MPVDIFNRYFLFSKKESDKNPSKTNTVTVNGAVKKYTEISYSPQGNGEYDDVVLVAQGDIRKMSFTSSTN